MANYENVNEVPDTNVPVDNQVEAQPVPQPEQPMEGNQNIADPNSQAVAQPNADGQATEAEQPQVQQFDVPQLQATEFDARVDELRRIIDESKEELRQLVKEQEKARTASTWEDKLAGMNPTEREALIQALNQSAANARQVGVDGIESKEQINNV